MATSARIKDYIKIFGVFAVAYLGLTRWAGFSERQAVALGLLVSPAANLLWELGRHHDKNKFEPFTITFVPQWLKIVRDQNLMSEQEMIEVWKEARLPGFRLLRDEFRLARLSPRLWFFDNYSAFRSKLDIRYELEELVRPSDQGRPLFFAPKFYFKEGSDNHPKYGLIRCIEFGIVTNDSRAKSIHWSDDRENVPLGKLPDAFFNGYYAGENFSLNSKINPASMAALLAEYGWKQEARYFDSPSTIEKLEHQFMTIYVDAI